MKTITVTLGERAYPIFVGTGLLDETADLLARVGVGGSMAIVTDTNVGPLYAGRLASLLGVPAIEMPAGEEHKRLAQIEYLCGRFLEANLDRSSTLVALGGGVVGDIAGYAAASFMRGIRFVQVPTTVVAQVDSSVGGKTGVNHPQGKNLIGAFHQPAAVVADLDLLRTLPDRELGAGMAEAIKHGVIADAELFHYLETASAGILAKDAGALEYPVVRSCEIKAAVVAQDEREAGVRAHLNYGHTVGHAIESVTGYDRYLHGEAVALGMVAAAHIACALGLVDAAFIERQQRCIMAYGLPVTWPDLPVGATLAAMKHDKKATAGQLKFVLATGVGSVVQRTDVPEAHVRGALEALRG